MAFKFFGICDITFSSMGDLLAKGGIKITVIKHFVGICNVGQRGDNGKSTNSSNDSVSKNINEILEERFSVHGVSGAENKRGEDESKENFFIES